MYFIDAKPSTVKALTVGTGGITKGDLVILSSTTIVRAAAAAADATVVGLATADAVDTATASIEMCFDRVIRAEYTGTASNLAVGKIYDLSDAHTVNIDDVTDGIFYCVGYNSTAKTIDGIITHAHRLI